jgi:hypothetical protein
MFIGAHNIIFSNKADEMRAFLRDVLELDSVDAGGGWLIFALPPAELAVHPEEGETRCELYLMCDDVEATVRQLKAKGVEVTQPITDQRWGLLTAIRMPDGSELGVYQPQHPTAIRRE